MQSAASRFVFGTRRIAIGTGTLCQRVAVLFLFTVEIEFFLFHEKLLKFHEKLFIIYLRQKILMEVEKMEESKNIRVTVSMPRGQVERMARIAEKMGLSRNAFMQIALADYMSQKEMINEEVIAKTIESVVREVIEERENDADRH